MTPDEMARFLRGNPQFFDQHPELLDSIQVTHPHGGRAIPLSERQIVALRDRARQLEGKLAELLRFGEDNDAIGEKVHRLSLALVGARDLAAASTALTFHLREDFAVPFVALRLWGRPLPEGTPEAAPLDEKLRALVETMGAPQCGPAAGNPFAALFPEGHEHVRSMALIPLGATRVVGLLALGSEDAQRFYPEMGTLFLRRIGELAAGALAARP